MKYTFPKISNISDVLPAIENRDEFVVSKKPNYTIINYNINYSDTFLNVFDENISEKEREFRYLRRECRGITFCNETGNIIRRPYHKFFNLNEKDETQSSVVDITQPHHILQKLDGSMISPFIVNDTVIFGTKMGETDTSAQALQFINNSDIKYNHFAREMIEKCNVTPIFEWCSRKSRIVIDYANDMLVLTAMRNLHTGQYMSFDDMNNIAYNYNIPTVIALTGSIINMDNFVECTKRLIDEEGYVVRFSSGYMIKIKADDYCRKHSLKDTILFEKNVLRLIVEDKIDDLLGDFSDADRACIEKYRNSVMHNMMNFCNRIENRIIAAKEMYKDDKKQFAVNYVPRFNKNEHGFMFQAWDNKKPLLDVVKTFIINNCSSQTAVNTTRFIIGELVWNTCYFNASNLSYQENDV